MAVRMRTAPGKSINVTITLDPTEQLQLVEVIESAKAVHEHLQFVVRMARKVLKVSLPYQNLQVPSKL